MSVNKFKVGDVVKCAEMGVFSNITFGKEYTVLETVDDGYIIIDDDKNRDAYYHFSRFELSDSDVSPQPPKFNESGVLC